MTDARTADEIDVRSIPKPQRHQVIHRAYAALAIGESFVLLNDHEPKHLLDEFELEYPASYSWESEAGEAADYRVRITKLARTALPRVVARTNAVIDSAQPDAAGSIWHLAPAARELDSNIVALAAGAEIRAHDGPDLDVMFLVLAGSGELETELTTVILQPGEIVWLPKSSRRRILAGSEGLRYLTVHARKPTLNLMAGF